MRAYRRNLSLLLALWVGAASPPAVPTASPAEPEVFTHESWQRVLRKVVDRQGLVDYGSLSADREQLDLYLAAVAAISPRSHPPLFPTRDHQLSYYLNAYNASVFQGVLGLAPDVGTVWGKSEIGYGFFVKTKVVLGGERTHLRKLENQVVRRRFQDPRIHAALNCASLGCPRLPRDVFAAEGLDEQLDRAMAEFLGDEKNCAVDSATGTVTLSKIFDWYRSDFEEHEARRGTGGEGLIGYINRYRSDDDQIPDGLKIRFLPFDKRLNRQ